MSKLRELVTSMDDYQGRCTMCIHWEVPHYKFPCGECFNDTGTIRDNWKPDWEVIMQEG